MSFKYTRDGGDDEYDQVLEITSDGFSAVVPKLDITPLDEAGQPIAA